MSKRCVTILSSVDVDDWLDLSSQCVDGDFRPYSNGEGPSLATQCCAGLKAGWAGVRCAAALGWLRKPSGYWLIGVATIGAAVSPCWATAQDSSATPSPIAAKQSMRTAVNIAEGYETNVFFRSSNGGGAFVTRASGEAGAAWQNERMRFSLLGDGDVARYASITGLDGFRYELQADAMESIAPRLSTHAAFLLRTSLSPNVGPDDGALPLLSLTLSRTQALTGTATYQLSETTTGTAEAGYTHVSFDSVGLLGGSTAAARFGTAHFYAPGASRGVEYELLWSRTPNQTLTTNALSVDWAAPIGPVQMRLKAGVAVLSGVSALPSPVRPVGDAEIRRQGATGAVAIHYWHTVGQAFGLGQVLATDQIGMAYEHSAPASTTFRAGVNQAWTTDETHARDRLNSTSANVDIRRSLGADVTLGLGGFFRRRRAGTVVAGNGLLLSAGYGAVR